MAGYNHYSGMSNNALNAYENGKKPLSRITALDLKLAGWRGTKIEAIHLAKSGFWNSCEWHHSGGSWYNKVNFYDPSELVDKWAQTTPENCIAALEQQQPQATDQRVRGEFVIWGGSRKRPKKVGVVAFAGVLKMDWIWLDAGGKKKATGNHITWETV
jgi:hypothetical protein|tara:strand:- start:4668 stop:5141 length:474 start_codon:yes stop_codon:yes gene_type:complete